LLDAAPDQLPKDRRRRLGVAESSVDGLDLDLQCLDQARQPRRLAGRELEDCPAQGGGVDNRVLERSGQSTAEYPGVERVVAVLDEHGATSEVEERPPGVTELGGVHQHLPLNQVAALGVGVDRCPGVDEGVEEAQRAAEPEALGPDLEDQEGPVPGRLDVDGDELGLFEKRVGADRREALFIGLGLPGDRRQSPARLEPEWAPGRFGHALIVRSDVQWLPASES
jgi:hypothetical protein